MTRIASVNVNGIRAAVRKGMNAWVDASDVDILTIQEVRGQREHLEAALPGWHVLEHESQQKGRAGVAIASHEPALASRIEFGDEALDSYGRWLQADFSIGAAPVPVVSADAYTGGAD